MRLYSEIASSRDQCEAFEERWQGKRKRPYCTGNGRLMRSLPPRSAQSPFADAQGTGPAGGPDAEPVGGPAARGKARADPRPSAHLSARAAKAPEEPTEANVPRVPKGSHVPLQSLCL
jgi:hypothetical protein